MLGPVTERLQTVSIHAPARGATCGGGDFPPSASCFNPRAREGRDIHHGHHHQRNQRFNPRAREGRDVMRVSTMLLISRFQSTRPRGARLWRRATAICPPSFNPRAREGRDVVSVI